MAKFQLGDNTSEAEVAALVDAMDVNKGGRIEIEEHMNKILGQGWTVLKACAASLEGGCTLLGLKRKALPRAT